MQRLPFRQPSPAMIVALIALFVVLGGSAYAAVRLSTNSVLSTHIKNGQVRGADLGRNVVDTSKVRDRSLFARDFRAGEVPAGPPGPRGPQGEPAARYFATVNGNGTLASGTASSARAADSFWGGGHYDVVFPADVSRCTGVLTAGSNQATSGGSGGVTYESIQVGYRHGRSGEGGFSWRREGRTVSVDVAGETGGTSSAFHLAVFC